MWEIDSMVKKGRCKTPVQNTRALSGLFFRKNFEKNSLQTNFSKKNFKILFGCLLSKITLSLSYTLNQSLFLKLSPQNNFSKPFLKKGKPNKFSYFLSQKLLYKHKPNTPQVFLGTERSSKFTYQKALANLSLAFGSTFCFIGNCWRRRETSVHLTGLTSLFEQIRVPLVP